MSYVFPIQATLAKARKTYDPILVHWADNKMCIKDCIIGLSDMRKMASYLTTRIRVGTGCHRRTIRSNDPTSTGSDMDHVLSIYDWGTSLAWKIH